MEDEVKVNIYMQSTASATVEVELTDEQLTQLANDLETTVENLTDEDIIDYASERAENTPTLCHHCAHGLDIGDFEIVNGTWKEIGDIVER